MRLIAPCAWQCGHPGELCTSYKQTPENHGVLKTRKLLSGATPANSLPNTSLRQQVQACATFSRQAHGKQYKPAPALQGKPCCRLACRLHVESKNLPTYLLTPAQCRAYHQRRSRAPYASAVLKTLLPATTLCQFPARQLQGGMRTARPLVLRLEGAPPEADREADSERAHVVPPPRRHVQHLPRPQQAVPERRIGQPRKALLSVRGVQVDLQRRLSLSRGSQHLCCHGRHNHPHIYQRSPRSPPICGQCTS